MSGLPGGARFLMGVGAEKAGTSWLHRRLVQHPDVWTPPHKEIHYFDQLHAGVGTGFRRSKYVAVRKALNSTGWEALSEPGKLERLRWLALQGLVIDPDDEWYLSLFAAASREYAVVGEITPAYGVIGLAGFEHMARLLPDARIVFLMRHPVERLWSATRYFASKHPESGVMGSPESMVAFATRPNNLAKSGYHHTIDHIAAAFPDHHVLYGFYEDIFDSDAEKLGFLRRVCALLEIDYDRGRFSDLAKRVNASPSRPMPPEFAEALSAETAPAVDGVEQRLGRVPTSWHAR
jgi:Sulfotransferase family